MLFSIIVLLINLTCTISHNTQQECLHEYPLPMIPFRKRTETCWNT